MSRCLSGGSDDDSNLKPLSLKPSSSCSFDGSLKTDQSDSEPNWPEVPPVLNQNEDRRRNKYLRKDYLKVWACTCLKMYGWLKVTFPQNTAHLWPGSTFLVVFVFHRSVDKHL